MQPRPLLSWTLVAIQFLALAVFLFTGPLFATAWPLLVMELAGFALLGWAAWSVRKTVPNVAPHLRKGATFFAHGPYAWIRHPMYLALLVITLPLAIDLPTPLRWAAWLLLLANLVVKLNYEEKLLVLHFPEYESYRQSTKRLIPYIY
jgi:protein-S-isoprenylcysteine O-methyltransferase Ste14